MLIDFNIATGDVEAAIAHMAHIDRAQLTQSPSNAGIVGRYLALLGRQAEARSLLMQLRQQRALGFVPASALAYIHIGLGENDEALRWLEVAYEERDVSLVWLKVLWIYDGLRSDPRFQSLLERMDFPQT